METRLFWGQKVKGPGSEAQKTDGVGFYDTIRYIYVRSKADDMASLV